MYSLWERIKSGIAEFVQSRIFVLIIVFCITSAILVQRIFYLQIVKGQEYLDDYKLQIQKTKEIQGTRGNIYDRNGNLLAYNELAYSVTIEDNGSYDSIAQQNEVLNKTISSVIKMVESNGDTVINNFGIILDSNNMYQFVAQNETQKLRFIADVYGKSTIDQLSKKQKATTADDLIHYLCTDKQKFGIDEKSMDKSMVLKLINIRYQIWLNSYQKYISTTIAEDVSDATVADIMENLDKLSGINVEEESLRKYADSKCFANIIGYTGQISQEEYDALSEADQERYSKTDTVGKAGLEKTMDSQLQGKKGSEKLYVNNVGKVIKTVKGTNPKAGNDLYLTIDANLQKAAYNILEQELAGVLLAKIQNSLDFDRNKVDDGSDVIIPIGDVYNALIANSVIDIDKFSSEDASDTEKNLYAKFQQKQQEVFDTITNRLTMDNPPAYKDESKELQEYLSYICDTILRDTLGVIKKDSVDTSDATYQAWATDQSISLKDYLNYAASQNWIDISVISPDGEYLDSDEVYKALTDYITDYLKTDTGFSKLLYKYMLMNDQISGQDICLVLYEQGVLSKDDASYESLASGQMSAYDFMINKIANLEIEPAQLALAPCSASAVITDVNTGKVLACVSYPGYDNNKLSNNMDTSYYSKLALDQSSPFFNKATQQTTAPGSTLKLLSTITGMMEGIIDDGTYYECTGKFDLVTPAIYCWNRQGHGALEIRGAIEQSCNYYFNMIGFLAGKNADGDFSETLSLSKLQQYASEIGLDEKTGIEISEASPHVSDSKAVPSYIGQGNHLFSTSQLARYATALATSGTVYDLSLLDKVTDSQGKILNEYAPSVKNQMSDVPDNVWEDIHDGMRRVVQTHEQFNGLGVTLSGKTGTAELDIYHPNHGLFIGYTTSPSTGEPEYALAVRIANGYSSGNACLTANDILQYIYDLADEDTILTGYASSDTSNTSND